MSLFAYSARTAAGDVQRGTIDADNLQAARLALSQMSLLPVEITETETTNKKIHWHVTDTGAPVTTTDTPVATVQAVATHNYAPLSDTVRLYAGWLVAWYVLVYILGWYAEQHRFPLSIPFLNELFHSQLVLSFSLAAFLYLFLSSVHRLVGRGTVRGLLLTATGILAFLFFQVNI